MFLSSLRVFFGLLHLLRIFLLFQNLTRDTVLKDIRDKELPAIDVFKHSIQYLKDRFVRKFKDRNLQITISPLENYVTWVITVPAIWDEPAKQFMEEAAERVG